MILDGGPTTHGLESTIVSVAGEVPVLLRAGAIPAEEIEEMLGVQLARHVPTSRPAAPGQMDSHYAPETPLVVTAGPVPNASRAGLVVLQRSASDVGFAAVEELSPTGDLAEAARNLFAALHRLEALDLDLIVVRPMPETGLGAAIMDRVRRAASRAAPETGASTSDHRD
jgi:L-threonylcarbamoyladenylate synthase